MRKHRKPRVGDLIEVHCWKHGWICDCAPGPWRLVRLADENGWIRAEHVTKVLSDGRPPTLGANADAIRVAR